MYFNANKIIKKKIEFFSNSNNNTDTLNIAYGIDRNFFLGCAVSISSILLFNSKFNFSFHVFTNSLSSEFERIMKLLNKQFNVNITIYLVDDDTFAELPTTKIWTIATYFRFIVANYFYQKIDKILYIDADIICKGSLEELFSLQFDDNIAYVVKDKDAIWWNKCAIRLNEPNLSKGYFNAGFLLINLNKWNELNINSQALKMLSDINKSKKLTHLDQDVLNLLLLKKVKYLDSKYNQQVSINYELKYKTKNKIYSPILDQTILIHYIGPTKPWHTWAKDYKCSQYFITVKERSPLKSIPLLSATNANQMRYCSKHKMHQKKYFSGIICNILYYLKKITKS
ncbi:lipopolysaccharide 1,3-galactosyltransferase [Gilliamella sp. W8126]|uniref:glycosyltransferase n=1 Tax=Gilliamella TaxID=1193503 RepID=UPI0018DB1553|nr:MULTISPECIES: glycosyltransferase [Gilliamella]MBI0005870.1 lipopolysaccharide 1,3-galactosyltransferase [Gilliamella sp. W8126]WLT06047.1 glycosyltransferase [Gilliamella apis]